MSGDLSMDSFIIYSLHMFIKIDEPSTISFKVNGVMNNLYSVVMFKITYHVCLLPY